MKIALITGSCGLVGAEAAEFFIRKKFKVLGIDNNFRKYFFGTELLPKTDEPKFVYPSDPQRPSVQRIFLASIC